MMRMIFYMVVLVTGGVMCQWNISTRSADAPLRDMHTCKNAVFITTVSNA